LAGLSPPERGFEPGLLRVGILKDEMVFGQYLLRMLISFPRRCHSTIGPFFPLPSKQLLIKYSRAKPWDLPTFVALVEIGEH
jgi:hypothetical protein